MAVKLRPSALNTMRYQYTREQQKNVAKRVVALRRRNHLTQARLAEMLGVCRKTVIRIERMESCPFPKLLFRIAELEERLESVEQVDLRKVPKHVNAS